MPATILTGIFTATDGSPVVDAQLVIRPTVKFVSAVGDGGQVPSSVSAVTNEMGRIGTVPTGGSFSDGLSLPVGQYEIAFVGLERAFGGKLTVTQDMVDAGSAPLGAALEPALAVVLPDVTVARNATFAARDLAIAFAESPTPPDPDNPESASAKTWAGRAAVSAQAASDDADATSADREQTGLDVLAAGASATSAADSAAAAQAVEFAQQDYLISAGALHTTALSVPSLAELTLDFGRRAFGRSEASAVSEVGVPADFLTATRASTATYVDATGTIQTAAANEARDAHHIWQDGAWRRRLLVEEQATNLAPNSEDITGFAKSGGGTFSNIASTAGGFSQWLEYTAEGADFSRVRTPNISVVTGELIAGSLFFDINNSPRVDELRIALGNTGSWRASIAIDPATGEITSISGGTGASSQPIVRSARTTPMGGGIFRFEVVAESMIADAWQLAVAETSTTTPGATLRFTGAQVERSSIVTSYIPTTGAQATRAADLVQIDAGKWPFAAGGFSVAFRGEVNYADTNKTAEARLYSAPAAGFEQVSLVVQTSGASTGTVIASHASGSFTSSSSAASALTPGASVPISTAARHSPTNVRGSLFGTNFASIVPLGLPDLSAVPLKLVPEGAATIEQLRIWATPLTDTQLAEASA